MENLSGISLDDVEVHRNSDKPAQLQAHAYAQGNDIHVGPGQEKHLPHEAWHVVQQRQGRVRRTMQMKGKVNINDDDGLEREADIMGAKALQLKKERSFTNENASLQSTSHLPKIIQCKTIAELQLVAHPVAGVGDIPNANPVFAIGATHTGDMYHVKAAMQVANAANPNVIITHVIEADNDASLNSAEMMAAYFGGAQIYYTTGGAGGRSLTNQQRQLVATGGWNNAVARGVINEGGASSVIMYGMDHANAADAAAAGGGHANRDAAMTAIGNTVGPVGARGADYTTDLVNKGHFPAAPGGTYVLVNYRQSGHQVGGVHPELDTGHQGFQDLQAEVANRFPAATQVPMGEYDPGNAHGLGQPNLYEYWRWDGCAGGREAQAGLLRHLKITYPNIIGAVGMRSGVTDLLALVGIPVVSIDQDPVARNAAGNPTDTQGKAGGWDRGMKFEKAFGAHYGRAFVRDTRANESAHVLAGWTGEFSAGDVGRIGGAMANTFGAAPAPRDVSHPLNAVTMNDTITRLEAAHAAATAAAIAAAPAPVPGAPQVPAPLGRLSGGENKVAKHLRDTIRSPHSRVAGEAALLGRLAAIIH